MPCPEPPRPPEPVALIACRVLEAEIALLADGAAPVVRREFFEIGLHDQPPVLHAHLAGAIERAEADPAVQRIVLVYGLCGLALVNLASRRCPVTVPRAHDCVTLYLGSKERYAAAMRAEPGTYWYSPGWSRARRVPGPEREAMLRAEYTTRFGEEDAAALLEIERESFALHTCAGCTDLGAAGDDGWRDYAGSCARALGWRFQHHTGDASLLRDLLHGPWDDERFLTLRPGERIAHSPDDRIVRAAPVAGAAPA